MESLKRANRFLNLDLKLSVGAFWIVMLFINIALYTLMYIFEERIFGVGVVSQSMDITYISIVGGNIIPSLIFFLVYCFEMYYEYFPMAVGFSVTRKDFHKATVINNLFLILIFAIIQSLLMKVDPKIIEWIGRNPYVDFGIFNTLTDNLVYLIFSLFVTYISITSVFNLLAVLTYRIGYKFWIGVGIILSLLSRYIYKPIFDFINQIVSSKIEITQLFILGIIVISMYLLSYFVVINTNIKNKTA